MPWVAISRLTDFHDTAEFRCGISSLDKWLRESAASVQAQGNAAVHVAEGPSGDVLGYFALSPHEPWSLSLPRAVRAKGRGGKTPAILLGKLALHVNQRGKKLGPYLTLEALRVAVSAADAIGGRVVVVDARDEKVADFYRSISFRATSSRAPLKLYMRVTTARKLIQEYDSGRSGI